MALMPLHPHEDEGGHPAPVPHESRTSIKAARPLVGMSFAA